MLEKITDLCQKKLKNNNWYPYRLEALSGQGILCIGAECPKIIFGKNRGKPNFKKKKKDTIEKVFLSNKELKVIK